MKGRFLVFMRSIFNLQDDSADNQEIYENIRKGIEFRGTNLWVLIFAIFIASVGLNVNSTAVIIGAMLVSPLMGPIMGIGFGVGTYDFELIKKSAKNLAVAVVISLITSSLYFWASPLTEAHSELLARTTPTIWDVLIALFGGLAGIVAATRKEKSNVIPGVAIATALMPPLCTAGYGLANGNLFFFLGAFYLFFINSVFISFATFIIVRFMKMPSKHFVDPAKERQVRLYVWIIAIVTMLPSIYMGYGIVQKSIYSNNALSFIQKELNLPRTQIITKNVDPATKTIEVLMIGDSVGTSKLQQLQNKLSNYKLTNSKLVIKQGLSNSASIDINAFKSTILEDLYRNNQLSLTDKNKEIQLLQQELLKYKAQRYPADELSKEALAIQPSLTQFGLANMVLVNPKTGANDTITLATVKTDHKLSTAQQTQLGNWIKARTKSKQVKLVTN